MKVAFGLKAHSGWAALVALGAGAGELHVVDRRRIELVDDDEAWWANQPYHTAEGLSPNKARDVIKRSIQSARRNAIRELRAALRRAQQSDHQVVACAMLIAQPMPAWTIDEILAVHFRMHQAEGALFRDALAQAAEASGLRLIAVSEKQLEAEAQAALAKPIYVLKKRIATLGKLVGPPWAKDQRDASLAAMIALRDHLRKD
jgi:hypothetical protein